MSQPQTLDSNMADTEQLFIILTIIILLLIVFVVEVRRELRKSKAEHEQARADAEYLKKLHKATDEFIASRRNDK